LEAREHRSAQKNRAAMRSAGTIDWRYMQKDIAD
jgi:hypothetical protein